MQKSKLKGKLIFVENVRETRHNGLSTFYKSLMFPRNYGTLFLAKLTISDCSGRCLLSVALKPSKACNHMGMDRETEEGERVYTCTLKINRKKSQRTQKREKEKGVE